MSGLMYKPQLEDEIPWRNKSVTGRLADFAWRDQEEGAHNRNGETNFKKQV